MKKITRQFIFSIIATALIFVACDDTTSTIGSSLITDNSEIVIDSSFTISGQSISNPDLPSRSATQILGVLNAKEYGSFSSELVAQFMPALQLDTVGVSVNDIDSVKMVMFYNKGNFTGDSIVPMGLKVYPLVKQLPSPIYSNFDPSEYYDEANCWTPASHIYTGNALFSDSLDALSYRSVMVTLPRSFGQKLYQEYLVNPETFATPSAFANFFPGIYIKNSFGSGRVINFSETRVIFYYSRHAKVIKNEVERDTVYNIAASYLAITPEVISNNIINLELSSSLTQKVNNGETLLVAPAGYDISLSFPAQDIIANYHANSGDLSVINTLTMSLPVDEITNSHNITPPDNVLLVLSKDKSKFFAQNKIADDKTSFLATYDSVNKCYDFTNLRQYILDLLAKDNITADDYTFTLTPVNVITETSSSGYYSSGQTYITGVTPYVSGPSMCKIDFSNAKIKFTYSKQSINY